MSFDASKVISGPSDGPITNLVENEEMKFNENYLKRYESI